MNGPIQPDYVTYDLKAREALLSQVGSLTPVERELFHRITKLWSPEISYQTILNIVSSESVSAKNDIESLMRKLRQARMGLLATAMQEGNRVPVSLILTNQDDYWFYHKLVEEELMDVVFNLALPLPSLQGLAERGVNPPPQWLTKSNFQTLAQLNSQREVKEHQILVVESEGPSVVVTGQTIKRMVTVALAKMQSYLQNSNLLSTVAQIKNMALLDIKRQVEARDPGFWTQLTRDVLDHQEAIRQNRKVSVDDQFWAMAYFLNQYLLNQLEETRRRKAAEQEKALDMKAIADQIKAAPTFLVSEEHFAEILLSYKNKHPDNFAEFKQEFEDLYLQVPDRKALPPLVHLSRSYIHQENVHAYFLASLDKTGRELFAQYSKLMEQYLKHPAALLSTAFYSPDNFLNDIGDQVRQSEPFLHELLQRPNLVAEAIILSAKKHKDVKSSDDLRASLAPFFHTDRIRYRDLATLFGLNIVDIFKISFLKLSVFRQIIMKISGKYESHHKRFDEFLESGIGETRAKARLRDDGETTADPVRRKPGVSAKQKGGAAGKTPGGKAAAKKQHSYSRSEQDSAWRNFHDSLKQ